MRDRSLSYQDEYPSDQNLSTIMDAKGKFFSRMDANMDTDRSHWPVKEDESDSELDIDFLITESGRTVAHMVVEQYGSLDQIDESPLTDMEFSVTSSGRTVANFNNQISERSGASTISNGSEYDPRATNAKHKETSLPSNVLQNQQGQQFQPLLPLPEHRQRSAPRAIPSAPKQVVPPPTAGPPSQPNSAGSTGSSFLNNLLAPAGMPNNAQLSHTPPTQFATSYESSHFAKRPRSGSISERLRFSTELEEKGMIDREQKIILKDLIISGDNDLQNALDKYEQGDSTELESMIQGGSLSNRAMNDIDLLGDLDLDFLTVHDDLGDGAAMIHQSPMQGPASNHPMAPPPPLPTREQMQQITAASSTVTPVEASDGIGELDFDGGLGDNGDNYLNSQVRAPSPPAMHQINPRSRSNSTFSLDMGGFRSRSNSLFSALIDTDVHGLSADYGRWMEQNPETTANPGVRVAQASRRASAPPERPSGLSLSLAALDEEDSDNMPMPQTKTSTTKEERQEEKRREKLEKKEYKEREKREKKEKREQAKLDKQKKAEVEEKEEHQPGSGRPRSMSDPNLRSSVGADGLLEVERPDGWIGAYSPESRTVRIERFLEKRNHRVWTKTVKYDVRKNFADSRLRVKGRFVKKEDELLMRELMSLT